MNNTQPSPTPVVNEIQVTVASPEEASFGVAELWSPHRQIGFTLIEDGEFTLRIAPSPHDVVLDVRALTEALDEAKRLLARY